MGGGGGGGRRFLGVFKEGFEGVCGHRDGWPKVEDEVGVD